MNKFRVYHKLHRRFLDPSEYAITGDGDLILNRDWHCDGGITWGNSSLTDEENLVIQRSTGRVDNFDKEIYDGDILLFCDDKPIIYSLHYCQFGVIIGNMWYSLDKIKENVGLKIISNFFDKKEDVS